MSSNPKITDWKGKRVWLVGASSGIGAAVARELAGRGARVALSARSADKLAALAIADALLLPCDATDVSSLGAAREKLLATWGGVDLVIYLAGDYVPMRADNFDLAVAEMVVTVNFNAAMRLTATVLGDLKPGGGIAFVASVAGYRGLPKALAYGPGKAALIHFAEVLHIDLVPKGIGVWVINPGFVSTQLTAKNDFEMPALQTGTSGNCHGRRLQVGQFRNPFPQAFYPPHEVLCAASLPLVFPAHSPLYRRLT